MQKNKSEGINIKRFMEEFNLNYEFLYDNGDEKALPEFNELIDKYDELLKTNPSFDKFVGDFSTYRNDVITSDREAASFMVTLAEYMHFRDTGKEVIAKPISDKNKGASK